MRKLRKRILIALGITAAILSIVYLGRRPLFESTIIRQAEAAIEAALGAEVTIGAVRGNWVTEIVIENIDIRGGADSAYREIKDLDVELAFAPFALMSGDLSGLDRLKIRCQRVELDTTKQWTRPTDEPDVKPGEPTALSDLLAMFAGGATVEIEELAVRPEYIASSRATITLDPGTARRQVAVTTGQTSMTGSIAPTGTFDANITGAESGRLLRALGIEDTMDQGTVVVSIKGDATTANLESSLTLATRLNNGAEVGIRYAVELKDGHLRAPQLHVDLPGITVAGEQLDIPLADLTSESFAALLGSLKIKITDLARYQAALPESVQRFLPITGDFDVTVGRGVVKFQPSVLRGKGFELRVAEGSISLIDVASGRLTLAKLRHARADGVGFELIIPEPIAIPLQGKAPLVLAGRISARVSGDLHDLDATASIDLHNLRFGEFDVGEVAGKITFDGHRVTLTEAKISGAGRRTDEVRFALAGGGAFELAKDGQPARVSLDLRGDVPPNALALAELPAEFVAKLKLPPATIRANLELRPGGLPIGEVNFAMLGVTIDGLDPIDLKCNASLEPGNVVRIAELSLRSETDGVRIRGDIGLDDNRLDLTADGKLNQLLPICRLLGQPDLEGSVELEKITAVGTLSPLPDVTIVGRATLTTISPQYFPAELRREIPAAPLDVSWSASVAAAGFDLTAVQLGWGQPDRRMSLAASGPLPLKFTEKGLEATVRGQPFTIEVHAVIEKPPASLKLGRVDIAGKIEIDAREVRIANLVTRSADGSIEARGMRAGIDLGAVLDNSIRWRDVVVAGEIELRKFWVGRLAAAMLTDATEVYGTASGSLILGGRIGQPILEGTIALEHGSISIPGAPKLESIEGTARFAERSIELTYEARTATQVPLKIVAGIRTSEQPLWQVFTEPGTPLDGELRVEGLDLALLGESLGGMPGLGGKVEIAGTVKGSLAELQPDVSITVSDAGWQLPDSAGRVDRLAAKAHLTRSRIELSDLHGVVPGLDLELSASGAFEVEDAALWEYLTDANPRGSGSIKFTHIPLEMLPRGKVLKDAEGIADGELTLAGTWSNLTPRVTMNVARAALKISSLPRIENLSARLVTNADGSIEIERLTATMGAGELAIRAKLTPADNMATLDAYAAGEIDATIEGDQLLLVRSAGLKLRGDIKLTARGQLDKINIEGDVTLDDSKYVKRFSLVPDLKVTGGASAGDTFGPWAIPGGDRLIFDVALKTKSPIELRTNVIDTDLDLHCRLQGQGSALTLNGACTSRTGTIRFPGMGMRISTMRLMFKGDAQPDILVIATGQRHGVRINLRLDGPIDDATPKLSSSPALQPRDLWSLITTGARPDALASNSAASNTAILATYVIQELVLTFLASESTEASQSFVSRFTFEFGRELSRDGAETWEVNFDVGELWYVPPRFGVRFERDVYEDYNLGLVYRWRF